MNQYSSEYFGDNIFSTDYSFIAQVIVDTYKPGSVIEFGCGPGHLTLALAKLGVRVDAIDGFSEPDFSSVPGITFTKINLDDEKQLAEFVQNKSYDVAICTEVAEHLNPASSKYLIRYITETAPVVVFSAAVPGQGGQGHINCQTRGFWHNMFTGHDFQLADSLRARLRANENLADWYKLNMLDYVSKKYQAIDPAKTIDNLIESESYSSSMYYQKSTQNAINEGYLKNGAIKNYLQLRRFLKNLVKRK